jgi:type VI secretion system (T6SS) effector TldE1-like protein
MSMSTGAYRRADSIRRKSSRRVIPQHLLGSVAVAGLVFGCAWTIYSNVLSGGIYPSMNNAAVDAHVIKRSVAASARPVRPPANSAIAALSDPAQQSSRAETLSPRIMFNERFAAAEPQSIAPAPVETVKIAEASPPNATAVPVAKPVEMPKLAEVPKKIEAPKLAEAPKSKDAAPAQVALNVPAPKPADVKPAAKTPGASVRDMAQRAKAAVMSIASNDKPSIVEKLWGKQPSHGSLLSFASADASVTGSLPDTRAQNPMLGGSPPYDRQTAVYDIAAHMVYLPDGTKLEAHSGLGSKLDDVRYSNVRMQGVTPPHIYELTPREALFHGVPALRLNPIGGEDKIFGRSGLLAHTYMLGPNGDSNGCVSFKDYYAFLNAYRNQGIKRLAVLAKVQ